MANKWDLNKEVFLNALFGSTMAVRFTDSEGVILKVNKSYCDLLGYQCSEVEGLKYVELLPAEYRAKEKELNDKLWKEGQRYQTTLKKKRKDGTYIDLNGSFQLVMFEGDTFMMTLYHDVSELTRLNELMGKIGHQAKLGGWERDLATDSIIWTDEIYKIYGIEKGTIPKFGDKELAKFYAPGELQKLINNHEFTKKTGERSVAVIRFKSADGKMKWVKNTTDAHFVDGKVAKLYGTFQDVTDEKNRELDLKQTQDFYKLLFDSNPNPIFLVNEFGTYEIVDINRAAEIQYGYSREEIIGESLTILRLKEDQEAVLNIIKSTSITGHRFQSYGPIIHRKKNGESFKVQVYWNIIEVGNQRMRLVITQDVSQLEENRIKLENTNRFLRTLINSSPVAIITLDTDGKVVLYNKKAEQLLGWSEAETVGDYLPYVKEDGIEKYEAILDKALHSEEQYVVELDRRNKGGETLNLRFHVAPLASSTKLRERVMLLIENVTDQNKAREALIESEHNYRDLVEASTDLIWKQNVDGEIIFVNRICEVILGYNPKELEGVLFNKIVIPSKLKIFNVLRKKVLKGEVFDNFDLQLRAKDGSVVHFVASVYPTFDAQGEIIGCTGTAGDITHVIEYQRQLEESIKEKEILIKEIHHRVKNNLSVLSGLLMLQAKSVDDDKTRRAFEKSQARIKSIATVHEKLYQNETFTRIEIKSYLEQLTRDIHKLNQQPGVNIKIRVIGDEINLSVNQAVPFGILANELIINAYKYAFVGRNKGVITLLVTEDEGVVIFSVSDNGVGLPDNFSKTKEGSLGMTLVDGLSKQLDGKLDIISDQGATFKLTFNPEM